MSKTEIFVFFMALCLMYTMIQQIRICFLIKKLAKKVGEQEERITDGKET